MKARTKKTLNFLERHVYQRQETVKLYEESHYISENTKKQIAKEILDLFREWQEMPERLRILDAGIGGGRLILLPLLDAALSEKEKQISLEIIGIDNSKPMIEDLRKNLSKYNNININNSINNSIWLSANINNSSIMVYNYDLEDYRLISELNPQFDAVISVLTLHHLKNWRLSLYSLVKTLKKGGYLILFEWTKGIKLRDGNFVDSTGERDFFKEIPEKIVDFWESFYKERNRYHQWVPEIMASDYSKINDVLKEPFFKPIKKGNGEDFDYTWGEKKEVTWNTLKTWIEERAYSNFHRGLSEEEHSNLLQWVNGTLKNGGILHSSTEEKLGCRLRIFKKQSDLDNFEKAIIFGSILESSIFEKLIYEQKKKDSSKRQFLDLATLLIQHDAITNNTSFFTLNLWDILIEEWHKEDKPLVFNRGFFDKKEDEFYKHVALVLLYYAIIEKLESNNKIISGTTFIFRDLLEKPMVAIHKAPDRKISRFFIRNIRTKTVEILLPESLLTGNNYLEELINDVQEKVKGLPPHVWKPLKEDIWNLIFDKEEVKELVKELGESLKEEELEKLVNKGIFNQLVKGLEKCFSIKPRLAGADQQGQIEKFCKALAFHLLIKNWDSMIYVPSEVLLPEEEKPFGFGGLIIAEENKGDEILKYYLSKRAEMLRIAINIKFRTMGATQWANKMVEESKKAIEFFRAFEHDTNRFIGLIRLPEKDEAVALVINNRSEVARLLLDKDKKIIPGVSLKKDTIERYIQALFNLIKNSKEDVAVTFNKEIRSECNESQWLAIHIILLNLISNTFIHYMFIDSEGARGIKVDVKVSKDNKGYLVLQYKQSGSFNFEPDGETVRRWLNGNYETSEKGFGHWIIQKIADRYQAHLAISLKKNGKTYKITKDKVEDNGQSKNSVDTELVYTIQFPGKGEDSDG